MRIESLLPASDQIKVESMRIEPSFIEVRLRCARPAMPCPSCEVPARRVHSRYSRIIRDLPWRGTPMRIRFMIRRFFCDHVDCDAHIFAEQLPEMVQRYKRCTGRFDTRLIRIGIECGGEPGGRLSGKLGIPTSGDTILRRLRSMPLPRFFRTFDECGS